MRVARFIAAVVTASVVVPSMLVVPARADRAEAQLSARTLMGIAQFRDEIAATGTAGMLGGLSLSAHYGVSNQLDLDAEVLALVGGEPTFDDAMVFVDPGTPVHGDFTRRMGSTLLMLGTTWRYGVTWVPVLSVAGGGGLRYRDNGTFTALQYVPATSHADVSFDLAASAKVGIERRVKKDVTVGAYASGLLAWSPSAPALPAAMFSLGISYVYYPELGF